MFINFKNADSILFHEMRDISFLHAQAQFPTSANGNWKAINWLYVLNFTIRAPLQRHLLCLIDKINLAVKRCLISCDPIQYPAEQGNVLALQGIPSRSEQIQRLTIPKENCFLGLMYY